MKRIISLFLMSLIFGTAYPLSHSNQSNTEALDLSKLSYPQDSGHIILVAFDDQTLNSVPESASTDSYRKRGTYQSSSWSVRVTNQIEEDYQLEKLTEWPMTAIGMHCAIYKVSATRPVEETLQQLTHDTRVEIAQPMHFFKTQANSQHDPYYKLQSSLQQMQIGQLHATVTGRQVNIAMIDTGVAVDHPDLLGQVSLSKNFAETISASFASDKHGTAVAGIMVAKKNNDTGIVGVAPDAKLMALKACWPDPVDSITAVCNTLTLAMAVNSAIQANADILNMSLTGPDDLLLSILLKKAIDKGMFVVASKSSINNKHEGFPASLPKVIAVQSTTGKQEKKVQPLESNYVLTAPGEKVLTTLPPATYDFISGSSISAAQVSGILALLLELKPDLNLSEAKALLKKAEQPVYNNDSTLVNAKAAIIALCATITCPNSITNLVQLQ